MMTPRIRSSWIGLTLAIAIGQSTLAHSYELRTHGEITRRAYDASEGVAAYLSAVGLRGTDRFDLDARTPREQLASFVNTGTAMDWIIEGAIREDEFIDNVFLAFLGCPRPANPSEMSRVLNHFFDVQRGGRGLTLSMGQLGLPAPDWALGLQGRGAGPKQNQFSLLDARDYQYQSMTASSRETRDKYTALLFRTLGHVLHILEDMAQPQHTRNDPHAGCMDMLNPIFGDHSWFEHYIEDRILRRPFPRGGDIPPEVVLGGYDPVAIRPYQDFFADPDRRGIADFSSRNFFSAGTNLGSSSEPCGGLVEPPCEATAYRQVSQPFSTRTLKGIASGSVTLYFGDVFDALTGAVIPNVALTSRSVWDQHLQTIGSSEKFSLNRFNYDAMADILLPRAVGYAAGFLNAFFRGSVGATYEGQSLRIAGSDEMMVGDFKLLYERTDGTRGELAAWVALRVDPGELSQPVSTPQLPADAVPGAPCFLIFRGQLGLEVGAVAGSQVPCPAAPLPPEFGPWTVYSCIFGPYGSTTAIRYRYATPNPPLWPDGLPALRFFLQSTTGETTCSLVAQGLVAQPHDTVTEHPV
jgi:hypothetical protein